MYKKFLLMVGSSLLICALSGYENSNKTQNTPEPSNIANSTNTSIPNFVNTSNSTLTFSSNSTNVASNNVKLRGKIVFTCDLKKEVVEKLGMKYIKEVPNGSYVTNLFGAGGAEIVVKNSKDSIIGLAKANRDGSFNIPLNKDNFYKILINFKSKKIEKVLSINDLNNLAIDLGRFSGKEILDK